MRELRKSCKGEIFDYGLLMSNLSGLKAPHRKITNLLKSGDIIRIKKGLYVFGEDFRRGPVSVAQLANLIYGPSYISQEYALSWYGMIPERVDTVTSMTPKRNKHFDTPLGTFKYTFLKNQRFTVGVEWRSIGEGLHILIASPEKALVDTIASFSSIKSKGAMRAHLIENLRMDEEQLKDEINLERLEKITLAYNKPVITLLNNTFKEGV